MAEQLDDTSQAWSRHPLSGTPSTPQFAAGEPTVIIPSSNKQLESDEAPDTRLKAEALISRQAEVDRAQSQTVIAYSEIIEQFLRHTISSWPSILPIFKAVYDRPYVGRL
ncbi:hypothetical protein L1049_023730 [Liquidambar formosana]|uniref:Uncharacterized protein n=1 Tax=Liquidambar formosana TaxID=63359 RepID=A0AAP0S0R7_LIQFO